MQRPNTPAIPLALLCLSLLSACEQLGLDDTRAVEAEGKAVGAACRHAGRALEDCYQFNPKAPKAAVFAGWKEMNDYMTEQKLEVIKPTVPPSLPKPKKKPASETGEEDTDAKPDESAESDASSPTTKNHDENSGDSSDKAAEDKASGKAGAKAKQAASAPTN
ncbi:hypothetical protein OPU71_04055 [Niveibacterium sp. 24ML]|uniref:hypothetical protein n=1 Tax=Niveibacterium sp. 24ML TaxID=2985512 RepID=UPI00227094C7|nr:hypothetical protein [Niveibacterium sp. 24ML]MCX9155290.1 hypothetical protein [Niveibacterium sp. 24ML]